MTRTTRKFAVACAMSMSAFLAPQAHAEDFGLHPTLVCDRHAPGYCYGPAQLTFEYSDRLGLIIDPKYVNNLGPFDALSLEFAFGAKEFRGAFTWGHALAVEHFIKVSLEYFAQEPDFSFISEKDSEWVGQKGIGIEYSYRPRCWTGIEDVHFNVLSNHAESETLASLPYLGATNLRRIVGGHNYGATLGITILPWPGARVVLDVHHDSVKFESKNILEPTLVGVGATVNIQQKISDTLMLELEGTDRQAFYDYHLNMNTLVNTAPGSRMEIFCRYSLSGGPGVPIQRENRYALGIYYSWGGDHYGSVGPSYHDPVRPGLTEELIHYTNKPAVRPPQIIAKPDQKVV